MKNKLVVLSMDAMVGQDLEYLSGKPNFARLMAHACRVDQVTTIYPSITYPAHVSLLTGCTAGTHGVYNNTELVFGPPHPPWHLLSEMIQREDIFALCKRAGLSTASVYWPVTGRNPNIDYLLNEYFFYDREEQSSIDAICAAFARQGASRETLACVRENAARFPSEARTANEPLTIRQTFDDFITGCVCSLIAHHRPDVLFAHNCYLDTLRHRHGVFNEYVNEGLDRTDRWLGQIIDALDEAGVLEATNFVILSDHGQMNYARRLKPNVAFVRNGFILLDESGMIREWKAYAQSNGMSVSVFVKDKSDEQEVHDFLQSLVAEGTWGFETLYTKDEVSESYGWTGDFSFVLETDGITAFSDDWHEPVAGVVDLTTPGWAKASHGYEPHKGPQPVFIATGPAFKRDAHIASCNIIDIAPTLAAALALRMDGAQGRALVELIR